MWFAGQRHGQNRLSATFRDETAQVGYGATLPYKVIHDHVGSACLDGSVEERLSGQSIEARRPGVTDNIDLDDRFIDVEMAAGFGYRASECFRDRIGPEFLDGMHTRQNRFGRDGDFCDGAQCLGRHGGSDQMRRSLHIARFRSPVLGMVLDRRNRSMQNHIRKRAPGNAVRFEGLGRHNLIGRTAKPAELLAGLYRRVQPRPARLFQGEQRRVEEPDRCGSGTPRSGSCGRW